MDFTPFATSMEGHSRIASKVPCEVDANPKIRVVTGGTANLHTLNIKNAFIKGTLDGNNNLVLSELGRSCLYYAELPNGVTDIILENNSNGILNFNERGYSVTVSARGTAIQHIGPNQTHVGS